jgi:hypothetical protein
MSWFGTVRVCLATLFALFAQEPLRAGVPDDAIVRLSRELSDFERLRGVSDMLPRLIDNRDAPVLKRLWDVKSFLGNAPYVYEDISRLRKIDDKYFELQRRYMGWEPNSKQIYSMDLSDHPGVKSYCSELAHNYAAQLEVWEKINLALIEYHQREGLKGAAQRLPKGLNDMREGVKGKLFEAFALLKHPGCSAQSVVVLSATFASTLSVFMEMLSVAGRMRFLSILRGEFSKINFHSREAIATAARNVDKDTCVRLCTVP